MYVEGCVCNVSGLTRSVVLPTPLYYAVTHYLHVIFVCVCVCDYAQI